MDTQESDNWLWRPLRSGNGFEALLPKSDCSRSYVGQGDTGKSIVEMVNVVEEYAWQTEKLAAKLQAASLSKTALNIHDFLYNHLQYKADKDDQLLRSPACSWSVRTDGIDCKSYSIFASCLLLNMGITHYIRKIKQPGSAPEDYTHVYVVVPSDQPGGNLDLGYYVIDGTLPDTKELIFTGKSDYKMSLQHYALNKPGLSDPRGINLEQIAKGISFKNFTKLGNFLSYIKCIGGSSLDDNGLKVYVDNILKYHEALNLKINTAIKNDNYNDFNTAVCEFFGNTTMFYAASEANLKKGWNPCTSNNIKFASKVHLFYRDTVGGLLRAFLAGFFDTTGTSGSMTFSSQGVEAKYGFRHMNLNNPIVISQPKMSYLPKLDKSIPAFTLTNYVADQVASGSPVNATTYIQGLTDIIKIFTPSQNGNSGTGSNNGTGGYYEQETGQGTNVIGDDPSKKPENKQMGLGTIAGYGLAAAGLYMFLNGSFKSQPGTKSNTK